MKFNPGHSIHKLSEWAHSVPLNTPEGQRRMEILYQATLAERRKTDPDFQPMTGLGVLGRLITATEQGA